MFFSTSYPRVIPNDDTVKLLVTPKRPEGILSKDVASPGTDGELNSREPNVAGVLSPGTERRQRGQQTRDILVS